MSLNSLWNIFKSSRAYWHRHAEVFARWSRADLVEAMCVESEKRSKLLTKEDVTASLLDI